MTDGILWLVLAVLKVVVALIGSLILLPVVVVVASAVFTAHHMLRRAWHSEHSLWYHAGRASVYVTLALKNPRLAVVAISTAAVATAITECISDAIQMGSGSRGGNPPPEIAPIQAANLRMPTTYPFERRRTVAPPFIGHRFALGDRS